MTASQEPTKILSRLKQRAPLSYKRMQLEIFCVTIYNENLRKLNGDESLRIMRLVYMIPS